jgi:hypothetical protein
MLFILVKNEYFFNVPIKMAFVLTSIIQFSIWTLSNFQEIIHLACMWLEIHDNLDVPHARWLAYCEGVELLSCSYPVDYTSIFLIFYVNLIGQRSFLGHKTTGRSLPL